VAVERGATHAAIGLPIQDAAGFAGDPSRPDGGIVLAVADGHGHSRHFRSARGAELAIDVARAEGMQIAPRIIGARCLRDITRLVRTQFLPELMERWRMAVASDLALRPLSEEESSRNDRAVAAYGTTLLVTLVTGPWLVLCQIGDGDTVVVAADDSASCPVPGDPRLDGHITTSLCQPDAVEAFRAVTIDLRERDVAAVLLATDGFGNAQSADPWFAPVGRDITRLAREYGIDWMREQLPTWVSRCASREGSADDAAVVLLLRETLWSSQEKRSSAGDLAHPSRKECAR
jgi:hypothetical protein